MGIPAPRPPGEPEKEEPAEGEGEQPGAAPAPQPARIRYRERPAGEEGFVRGPLPDKKRGDMFGIASQLQGGSRLRVNCEDGRSRLARIPGKMKRRMWIREGDLVIVRPWQFQDEKCDIVFRYTKTQAAYLSRRGLIPRQIDVF